MKIPDARAMLTHGEMEKVTEAALATGPFSIENVRRIGSRKEVKVRFTKLGKEKTIILDPKAVSVL